MGSVTIQKLQNGNVLIDDTVTTYSYNPDMQVVKQSDGCIIRSKVGNQQDFIRTIDVVKLIRKDGIEINNPNLNTLFSELINFFFF